MATGALLVVVGAPAAACSWELVLVLVDAAGAAAEALLRAEVAWDAMVAAKPAAPTIPAPAAPKVMAETRARPLLRARARAAAGVEALVIMPPARIGGRWLLRCSLLCMALGCNTALCCSLALPLNYL